MFTSANFVSNFERSSQLTADSDQFARNKLWTIKWKQCNVNANDFVNISNHSNSVNEIEINLIFLKILTTTMNFINLLLWHRAVYLCTLGITWIIRLSNRNISNQPKNWVHLPIRPNCQVRVSVRQNQCPWSILVAIKEHTKNPKIRIRSFKSEYFFDYEMKVSIHVENQSVAVLCCNDAVISSCQMQMLPNFNWWWPNARQNESLTQLLFFSSYKNACTTISLSHGGQWSQ